MRYRKVSGREAVLAAVKSVAGISVGSYGRTEWSRFSQDTPLLSWRKANKLGSLCSPPPELGQKKVPIKRPGQSCRKRAVHGLVEAYKPLEAEVADFALQMTGKDPTKVVVKADGFFRIEMVTEEDVELLVATRVLFKGVMPVHVEPWTSQKDPDRTSFEKCLKWIHMPGLREECVNSIEDMVEAFGELYMKPKDEEFGDLQNPPKICVKVGSRQKLPKDVILTHEDDGVEEEIYQRILCPGQSDTCEECGSEEHQTTECMRKKPWLAAVMGLLPPRLGSPGAGGKQGQGAPSPHTPVVGGELVTPARANTRGKGGQPGNMVLKVGVILLRRDADDERVWFPMQEKRLAFPMWNFHRGGAKEHSLQYIWSQAEVKMASMIMYDFPGVQQEAAEKLVKDMNKCVVSHNRQGEAPYLYFVGIGRVAHRFDIRAAKKSCWFAKSKLAQLVMDGNTDKGNMPMSTRVLAGALLPEYLELRHGLKRC